MAYYTPLLDTEILQLLFLGYFYDITNNDHPDDSDDHIVESKCSFINGLNRGDFAKILEHWGARETHIMAVALDQPF